VFFLSFYLTVLILVLPKLLSRQQLLSRSLPGRQLLGKPQRERLFRKPYGCL